MTTTTKPDRAGSRSPTQSPKADARWAAIFYTALVVFGGLAHVYVRGTIYVPGDAATTASNVAEFENLARFGVISDLIGATAYLFLAFAFHRLLRHVSRELANVMVTLVSIGAGMTCLNMVFQIGGILTATESSYTQGFDSVDAETLTLLMFDLQFYGYILVQVFTGLWLIPLGLLAQKSGGFPKALPWLLMIGGACYLTDLFIQVAFPDTAREISELVLAPAVVAEVWMVTYLWFRGVGKNFISAS